MSPGKPNTLAKIKFWNTHSNAWLMVHLISKMVNSIAQKAFEIVDCKKLGIRKECSLSKRKFESIGYCYPRNVLCMNKLRITILSCWMLSSWMKYARFCDLPHSRYSSYFFVQVQFVFHVAYFPTYMICYNSLFRQVFSSSVYSQWFILALWLLCLVLRCYFIVFLSVWSFCPVNDYVPWTWI